jgi:GH24 family phage-related lysozyme (muramidase)
MADEFIDAYKPFAAQFEGTVPWMYRDSRGYLTIGIGHLLYKTGDSLLVLQKAIKALFNHGSGPRSIRQKGAQALSFVQACNSRKPGPYWKSVQRFITSVDTASGAVGAPHDKVFGVLGIELPEDHESDWQAMMKEAELIMKLPFGQHDAGGFFRCYNSYEMVGGDIDTLFRHDVHEAVMQLKGMHWVRPDAHRRSKDFKAPLYPEFQNFDKFPEAAKMAIVDLAFQLGAAGLANYGGGAFRKAVGEQNWGRAAILTPQPSDAQEERNEWRKQQLEEAADTIKSVNVSASGGKDEKKVKSTSVEKPRVPTAADLRTQGQNPAGIEVKAPTASTGGGPAIKAMPKMPPSKTPGKKAVPPGVPPPPAPQPAPYPNVTSPKE